MTSERLAVLARTWPHHIPFERAVSKRHAALVTLIDEGVTWTVISRVLFDAGVRQRDGTPMSPKQANTVFLRVSKKLVEQGRQVQHAPSSPDDLHDAKPTLRQKADLFAGAAHSRTAPCSSFSSDASAGTKRAQEGSPAVRARQGHDSRSSSTETVSSRLRDAASRAVLDRIAFDE